MTNYYSTINIYAYILHTHLYFLMGFTHTEGVACVGLNVKVGLCKYLCDCRMIGLMASILIYHGKKWTQKNTKIYHGKIAIKSPIWKRIMTVWLNSSARGILRSLNLIIRSISYSGSRCIAPLRWWSCFGLFPDPLNDPNSSFFRSHRKHWPQQKLRWLNAAWYGFGKHLSWKKESSQTGS